MISDKFAKICLAAIIAVLTTAFGIPEIIKFLEAAKEIALKKELQELRAAISFHKAHTSKYPASLEEAAKWGRSSNITFILENIDHSGSARDPFGRHYTYNPSTGEVKSSTPGYENY